MNTSHILSDVGLPLQINKNIQDRFPRKRKPWTFYPGGVKKHPVTLLYEYCRQENVYPVFRFYEIPLTHGIEYGCIVRVKDFCGEGQSFSKRTAKQYATCDILWKLTQSNYYGEPKNCTKRFVSETGVITVHYEEEMDTVKRKSCFRSSSPSAVQSIKKELHFQVNSKEGSEIGESTALDVKEKPLDKATAVLCEDKIKKEIEDNFPPQKNAGTSTGLVNEIDDYLSERLLATNLSETTIGSGDREDDSSEDEILEVGFNDEPEKKRIKWMPTLVPEASSLLRRKSLLRELNPVGYLQEACQLFKIPPPLYILIKKSGNYRVICILEKHKEQANGITWKQAKRLAALQMVGHRGW